MLGIAFASTAAGPSTTAAHRRTMLMVVALSLVVKACRVGHGMSSTLAVRRASESPEKSVRDEAREIESDRHPWLADVARGQPGNLVEPVDHRVAVGADLAIGGTIAAEFAPQKSRGPLLVVLVTMLSVGAAIAYTVGYFMLNLGPDAWRWMLASSAIPALLILTMRLGTPESPRWLLSNGRAEEAEPC